MKIKVPKKITPKVIELCQEISGQSKPQYIPVYGEYPSGDEDNCIINVANTAMKHGGDFQHGWAIWEWPDVMLEAEFWTVWVNPEGQLIDVTPRHAKEGNILFLPDNIKPEGKPVDSIVKPLQDHPLLHEYIEVNQKIWDISDEMEAAGKDDVAIAVALSPLLDKKDKLEREIDDKLSGGVGRNDLCPCGSGKKFKKCCGH